MPVDARAIYLRSPSLTLINFLANFLYLEVGNNLADAIRLGALKAGDRLPSVRALCRERSLSLATAVAAYRWLEVEGYVEARPRSGYFVRPRCRPLRPTATTEQMPEARLVGVNARNMHFFAAQRKAEMAHFGFAIPSPTLFPAEALRRQLNRCALQNPELLARYPENDTGLPALKAALARRLSQAGVVAAADEFIITNGCTEALNLALRAVTRPGDTVLVESPTYYGLLQIIETQGLKALEIPSDPHSGPSLAAIDAATREPGQIKAALLVPNFANPSGSLMTPTAKARLCKLLTTRQVTIIEDDMYGEMSHDGARPPLIKHWDSCAAHIACGSFNKSLAPGFRLGWILAGRQRLPVEALKYESSGATSPILQAALAAYLDSGAYDRHLTQLRTAFRRQTARIAQWVSEYFPAGTRISEPRGGFVLWIALAPGQDADRLAALALADNIAIAPGSLFSLDGRFRHCLRLNCGHPTDLRSENAIRRLGQLAQTL